MMDWALVEPFLAQLRMGKSVQVAADLAGLNRRRVYRMRHRWPEFRLAWDRAACESRFGDIASMVCDRLKDIPELVAVFGEDRIHRWP
jgi:hypothetical protein